jgi:hypothetical protein
LGGPPVILAAAGHGLSVPLLADLGPGLAAYPIEGIGSALLITAVAISSRFDRLVARAVSLPLYFAVAFSVIGLLLTVKAAPIMFGLAAAHSPTAVERAFDEFYYWGLYLRGFVDVLAFAALVWALSKSKAAG